MALDKEMFILRAMVEELEQLGYAVEERVIDTCAVRGSAVPSAADLVALRRRTAFTWPAEHPSRVSRVERDRRHAGGRGRLAAGGWRGRMDRVRRARRLRSRGRCGPVCRPADSDKLFDHITRPVREDDARAFELMDSDDPVLGPAGGGEAVPRRHLRRQVQAARSRTTCRARSPRTSPRTATGTSIRGRTGPSRSARRRACRPSRTGTVSPGRRRPRSARSATPCRRCSAAPRARRRATLCTSSPSRVQSPRQSPSARRRGSGPSRRPRPAVAASATRWQVVVGETMLWTRADRARRGPSGRMLARWPTPEATTARASELVEIARLDRSGDRRRADSS